MELRAEWKNQGEVIKGAEMASDGIWGDVREAMREAAHEVADFILFRGAEDITEAGNFGGGWIDMLKADVTETQRTVRVEVDIKPDGPPMTYWKVFEYGATIFAHNASGLLTFPNKSGYSVDGKVPAFISVHSVTIPKKFHLTEIIRDEASKARAVFDRIMSER